MSLNVCFALLQSNIKKIKQMLTPIVFIPCILSLIFKTVQKNLVLKSLVTEIFTIITFSLTQVSNE